MAISGNSLIESKNSPLYRQIATILKKEIRTQYNPNDPLPSQRELAQRFKTSSVTVGNALRELANEGMVTRTERMGTFVTENQNLSQGLVGLLMSFKDALYTGKLLEPIHTSLHEARLRPVFYGGNADYEQELEALGEIGRFREVGAIVYSVFLNRLVDKIDILVKSGVPVVTINRAIEGCDCAQVDQFAIGALQADYLLEKQAQRILYLDICKPGVRGTSAQMHGFLSTFIEKKQSMANIRAIKFQMQAVGDQEQQRIEAEIQSALHPILNNASLPHPDAVVCNDGFLLQVVAAMNASGLRPETDIRLVGDDDHELPGFPYATVDENITETGRMAVRMLMERIEKKYEGPQRIHSVAPRLVIHEGT